ncbi:NAD-dependent epimerase/dehydratase family protein [Sciscionella sediminilitoris]|uniref:NAD-dependent epimerase/dehydratase family protein n=1 Tax=Sciscionella sediminilitoris TaxID=1445613 RepID=UPI0004DEFF2C|nr:NAD-dependent epimerase/dehydratase family protein [Sciscionella sp. SE31]
MSGRVLVTGGCGFIGRAVVAALRASGTPVTVVDREPWLGSSDVDSVQGELAEAEVRERALTEDVDAVVHLAAVTSVLKSKEDPVHTYEQNVAITQGLLELARQRGTRRFVLASTNAVVGDVGTSTITTDRPLAPLTPYGATKAACEMLLSGYYGAYGLSTCALRFTNVYGHGMSHKDSFVPRMMRAALSGEGVRIYGDGKQSRDLVHIDDVARAVLLAIDSEHTGPAIVGAGHSVSVLELVAAVRSVTGRPLPAEHIEAPKGEMPAVVVDVSASAERIGFTPNVALHEGLTDTWKYFQETWDEA